MLQKVISLRNRDQARIKDPSLFPLERLPEILEGRIGRIARSTVETGGEHDGRHRRWRMSHHSDPAGDDVEMFGVLGVESAHDDEGLSLIRHGHQRHTGDR